MISLFIDTSLSDVSIALVKEGKELSQIHEYIPGKHSIYVTKYISDILKNNNLSPDNVDEIIVVNGPGSFTGIRIGVTIAKMFNPNVARLVMLVTKKEGVNYKHPEAIKEYLQNISTDMNAAAIKASDRMHNMLTLDEKTFEARYRKAIETKTYYLPFFKQCRYMYPRYENLFYAARAQIEPLIYHIESFYNELQRLQEEINNLK